MTGNHAGVTEAYLQRIRVLAGKPGHQSEGLYLCHLVARVPVVHHRPHPEEVVIADHSLVLGPDLLPLRGKL